MATGGRAADMPGAAEIMASKYWIKLYHEILSDPKMGRMPDKLWRRTIELFLLAGEYDQDGTLPSLAEMAWVLRITEEECNVSLQELQRLQIVHCNDAGEWVVTHFADRQSAADSAERSRQHRQRKQREKRLKPLREAEIQPDPAPEPPKEPDPEPPKDATKMQRNVAPDTDTDTDTDSSPNGELASAAGPAPGPKTVAKDAFCRKTGLKMPEDKPTQKFWWGKFGIIAGIYNKDPTLIERGINQVVDYMAGEGLTITGPQSIADLCRSQAAGQLAAAKAGKNAPHKNGFGEVNKRQEYALNPLTGRVERTPNG